MVSIFPKKHEPPQQNTAGMTHVSMEENGITRLVATGFCLRDPAIFSYKRHYPDFIGTPICPHAPVNFPCLKYN
jgi:hypothetical protein